MSMVEAVYQHGVFKPLGEVTLAENQRVRLHVEPNATSDWQAWLEQVRGFQQRLAATAQPVLIALLKLPMTVGDERRNSRYQWRRVNRVKRRPLDQLY